MNYLPPWVQKLIGYYAHIQCLVSRIFRYNLCQYLLRTYVEKPVCLSLRPTQDDNKNLLYQNDMINMTGTGPKIPVRSEHRQREGCMETEEVRGKEEGKATPEIQSGHLPAERK